VSRVAKGGRPRLRIVGGTLAGRRFGRTIAEATRPTSDRVREGIASALDARGIVSGALVLDLFAGTGALAFEALSRGADRALLVEADVAAARAIEESIGELGLGTRARVVARAIGTFDPAMLAREGPFGLIFADPPYECVGMIDAILRDLDDAGAIVEAGWLVLEHGRGLAPSTGPFETISDYRYGDTEVILARRPPRAGSTMEQA
jgi:16S rRNA (guanine966-N2)-methyltransferase